MQQAYGTILAAQVVPVEPEPLEYVAIVVDNWPTTKLITIKSLLGACYYCKSLLYEPDFAIRFSFDSPPALVPKYGGHGAKLKSSDFTRTINY